MRITVPRGKESSVPAFIGECSSRHGILYLHEGRNLTTTITTTNKLAGKFLDVLETGKRVFGTDFTEDSFTGGGLSGTLWCLSCGCGCGSGCAHACAQSPILLFSLSHHATPLTPLAQSPCPSLLFFFLPLHR